MAMLRNGLTDVNTTDEEVIHQAGDDLRELTDLMNIKVNIEGYKDVPEGVTNLAHTWSGDMIDGAYSYLPEGTDAVGARLVVPERRRGHRQQRLHGRDRRTPRTRCSPTSTSTTSSTPPMPELNFEWVGYLPPIDGPRRRLPDRAGIRAREPALRRCSPTTSIAKGLRFEPLPIEADQIWEDEWSKFTAG